MRKACLTSLFLTLLAGCSDFYGNYDGLVYHYYIYNLIYPVMNADTNGTFEDGNIATNFSYRIYYIPYEPTLEYGYAWGCGPDWVPWADTNIGYSAAFNTLRNSTNHILLIKDYWDNIVHTFTEEERSFDPADYYTNIQFGGKQWNVYRTEYTVPQLILPESVSNLAVEPITTVDLDDFWNGTNDEAKELMTLLSNLAGPQTAEFRLATNRIQFVSKEVDTNDAPDYTITVKLRYPGALRLTWIDAGDLDPYPYLADTTYYDPDFFYYSTAPYSGEGRYSGYVTDGTNHTVTIDFTDFAPSFGTLAYASVTNDVFGVLEVQDYNDPQIRRFVIVGR